MTTQGHNLTIPEQDSPLWQAALHGFLDLQDLLSNHLDDRSHPGWKSMRELAAALGEPLEAYWLDEGEEDE